MSSYRYNLMLSLDQEQAGRSWPRRIYRKLKEVPGLVYWRIAEDSMSVWDLPAGDILSERRALGPTIRTIEIVVDIGAGSLQPPHDAVIDLAMAIGQVAKIDRVVVMASAVDMETVVIVQQS